MAMLSEMKRRLYFVVAWYFRFWAGFRLRRWHPTVILVTGSSGKTTLLHLLEAQLGSKARYSHHANSAIGIPFDILDMTRETLTGDEWLKLFLLVFVRAFSPPPPQRLYVAEADCDRPGEGKFLGSFLKPDVTVWLNVTRTHSMNFDSQIGAHRFPTLEAAIGHEFGYYIEYTRQLAVVNADIPAVTEELPRTEARVIRLTQAEQLTDYTPTPEKTDLTIGGRRISLPALVPEETWYAVAGCLAVLEHLDLPIDATFSGFRLPPGRSSVFRGRKGITIIDSSYNSNLASATAVLRMFKKLKSGTKWLVVSDMLEQGSVEKEEHQKLAHAIAGVAADRVILMGPRATRYTFPVLKKLRTDTPVVAFQTPLEVLRYLEKTTDRQKMVLFKGGRFLEGVIEHLLEDPADAAKLCRREKIWRLRRKKWGL